MPRKPFNPTKAKAEFVRTKGGTVHAVFMVGTKRHVNEQCNLDDSADETPITPDEAMASTDRCGHCFGQDA